VEQRIVIVIGRDFSLKIGQLKRIQNIKSKSSVGAFGAGRKPGCPKELDTLAGATDAFTECERDGVLTAGINDHEIIDGRTGVGTRATSMTKLHDMAKFLKRSVDKE
jgi:hypothetical protein